MLYIVASVVDTRWISGVLGQDAALVRCLDDMRRRVDPQVARDGHYTGFSDGFPYLIVFQESLVDLLGDTYGDGARDMMPRFRGNVIVEGGEPWQEDAIQRVSVECARDVTGTSNVVFDLCKPCSRCTVPTVDPGTGAVDRRVFDLLRSKRSGRVLGWTNGPSGDVTSGVFFGVNAVVEGVEGVEGGGDWIISVGSEVEVVGRSRETPS
jgi:uncharacterized protein YcbX